jgi:methionyl-tRNA formyltransferase
VELVLLIGYMRIVSPEFINRWRWRVVNVHPSLLPEFAGGMDCDVHSAVLAAKKDITGCTIHYLTEVVDGGPIILQKQCPVDPSQDTPDLLKARVQALEGEAFIEVIQKFRDNEIGPHFRDGLPNVNSLTYKAAGVDIDAGEALVDKIKPFCKFGFHSFVLIYSSFNIKQVHSKIGLQC